MNYSSHSRSCSRLLLVPFRKHLSKNISTRWARGKKTFVQKPYHKFPNINRNQYQLCIYESSNLRKEKKHTKIVGSSISQKPNTPDECQIGSKSIKRGKLKAGHHIHKYKSRHMPICIFSGGEHTV